MQPLIEKIEAGLKELPDDKLAVVLDFVSYLAAREKGRDDLAFWLAAAETSLAEDWSTPEEDAAWAHLQDR